MSEYVSNQNAIRGSLCQAIEHREKFSIVKGISGRGKSFLMDTLSEMPGIEFYKLSGDYYSRTRVYYPFRTLLNTLYADKQKKLKKMLRAEAAQNAVNQVGSFSPLGADFLSTCIAEISGTSKKMQEFNNVAFSKDELELLFPLEYFCGGEKISVFLLDDLQYWDDSSLQLLYSLIQRASNTNVFLKNMLFVATINISQVPKDTEMLSGLAQLAGENIFLLEGVTLDEYSETLKILGCSVELDSRLISALYSITMGNLQLTADIVLLLNHGTEIEETIRQIILNRDLGHLLVERLNKISDYGALVNEALKYGALFGNSFYYHDLEPVLELKESSIRGLIDIAQTFSLVKGTPSSASFIHELIRETYKKETNENKVKYYTGFASCLKLLHPGDYRDRAESLLNAGEYEMARTVRLLDFIKELRNHRLPSELPERYGFTPRLLEYSDSMKLAYSAFDEGNYRFCLEELELLEDIYPQPLLAEKYYLMSVTLSKWLNTRSRIRSKRCLDPFLEAEDIDNETEVWERIISAYIVACIHNNDIDTARRYEIELKKSITVRIDFDMEASFRLNTLRRKASSIYPPTKSFTLNRKSKDFFAPNRTLESSKLPLDPVEYYMSLNNYVATALMAGKAADVFREASELINLPQEIKYLKFPRYEMPLNNAILVAYLNRSITAKEAQSRMEMILCKCITEDSTSTIIRVNVAIFMALNGEITDAEAQLERLYSEMKEIHNLEFYYRFLIEVNFSSILFMNGAQNRAITILESICSEPMLSNDESLEAHAHALYQEIMSSTNNCTADWYNKMLPSSDYVTPASWDYYGHKYLFGELEFWSES